MTTNEQRQPTASELRAMMTAYRRDARYFTAVQPDPERAAWYQQKYDETKAALNQVLKGENEGVRGE
jgi:hypothetical protein